VGVRRIETIVFDASGVLFDDLYAVWKADSDAFEACGFEGIESLEHFKEAFRFPISEFCRSRGVPDSIIPSVEKEFRRVYPRYSGFIRVFPEVKNVLERLRQAEIVPAVASNIPSLFLREHLQQFGIDGCFDAVTGQDDCEEVKPSPKPILTTLEKLGRKPDRSAYVGDMEEDIMAGKRANVCTIAVSRDSSYHPAWRLRRQNPDFLIHDLEGLVTIVETLNCSTGRE